MIHPTSSSSTFFNIKNKDTKSLAEKLGQFKENTSEKLSESGAQVCPIDVLPPAISHLVEELSSKYKFPKDFCLVYILFVASVAIGNNWRAEVKKKWHEPALLYLCVVALAGQMKTPVQKFFTEVLRTINKEKYDTYKAALEQYEQTKRSGGEDLGLSRPRREQVLIHDSTFEATIKALESNPRGLGILFDELAGFFGGMNKYNKGNDIPFYLSTFNCESYTSNRKTSEDSYLADPYLSIVGSTQPGILKRIFSGDLLDNGMKDRFLMCYPENLKMEVVAEEDIDQSLIDSYTDAITFLIKEGDKRIQDIQANDPNKRIVLPIAEPAKKKLFEYWQGNADAVNKYNEEHQERLASTMSKYNMHVVRLSLIIQLLTDACNGKLSQEVTLDSVLKGIRLCEYFKWHTKRVHGLISGDPLATLDENKRAFYMALPDTFTTAEAIELAKAVREDELNTTLKVDSLERWTKRFLDSDMFQRLSHGRYQKHKP